MRREFQHRSLYLHETTRLGIGDMGRYDTAFSQCYRPAMERLGARLFSHWKDGPFNSRWHEITTIQEIDGYAHFGALSAARTGSGEDPAAFAEWEAALAALRDSWDDSILSALPGHPLPG
ncbi:MAG: hypothetical protein ACK2U9_22145 [Anaerolineae bacterium]